MASSLISLGIGSPASISSFILFGLSPQQGSSDPPLVASLSGDAFLAPVSFYLESFGHVRRQSTGAPIMSRSPVTIDHRYAVPELSTPTFTATLKDDAGELVDAADVTAIYMTLRETAGGTIVNSRDNVNVLASGIATVEEGAFAVQFASADMAAVGSAQYQERRLSLDLRLTGGGRVTHEVTFYVYNLADVTA